MELIVNATIRFTACTQRLNAQPSERCTHDYVILHHYDTNTLSETQRTTTTNYQPYLNNSESSSRLQQDRNDIRSNTNIINRFRRPINFNYTYLGLRDIGSSGSVVRIFMYYEVCPRKVEGLAIYPEVPHPGRLPEASTRTTRLASCAEHSHNTTSLDTYAYQDGRCEQNITCVCDAGYEQSQQNPHQCAGKSYIVLLYSQNKSQFYYSLLHVQLVLLVSTEAHRISVVQIAQPTAIPRSQLQSIVPVMKVTTE